MLEQVLDGWQRGSYARVVTDLSLLQWNVEVHTDQHAFAGDVQRANRFLIHVEFSLYAIETRLAGSERGKGPKRRQYVAPAVRGCLKTSRDMCGRAIKPVRLTTGTNEPLRMNPSNRVTCNNRGRDRLFSHGPGEVCRSFAFRHRSPLPGYHLLSESQLLMR